MFNEFIDYMLYWIAPEEFILAIIGLIVVIGIWIAGGKYEKKMKGIENNGESK